MVVKLFITITIGLGFGLISSQAGVSKKVSNAQSGLLKCAESLVELEGMNVEDPEDPNALDHRNNEFEEIHFASGTSVRASDFSKKKRGFYVHSSNGKIPEFFAVLGKRADTAGLWILSHQSTFFVALTGYREGSLFEINPEKLENIANPNIPYRLFLRLEKLRKPDETEPDDLNSLVVSDRSVLEHSAESGGRSPAALGESKDGLVNETVDQQFQEALLNRLESIPLQLNGRKESLSLALTRSSAAVSELTRAPAALSVKTAAELLRFFPKSNPFFVSRVRSFAGKLAKTPAEKSDLLQGEIIAELSRSYVDRLQAIEKGTCPKPIRDKVSAIQVRLTAQLPH